MSTENLWVRAEMTPTQVEAIVRQARAERAAAMRAAIAKLPALLKRLVTTQRPSRERLPQAGALA